MDFVRQQMGEHSAGLGVTVTLSVAATLLLHFYYKNKFSYWQRRGVRGPRPWPFVGNLVSMLNTSRSRTLAKWRAEYGNVYGVYEGVKPVLLVADAELVQQIAIKDFEVFMDHDTDIFVSRIQRNFIYALHGEHWKQVRSVLSPTFSGVKMKRMYKLMELSANDLRQVFEEKLGEVGEQASGPLVQLRDIFSLFAMDAVTSCCYGIKLDRQKSSSLAAIATRDQFVRLALKVFEYSIVRALFALSLSQKLLRRLNFSLTPENHMEPFANRIAQMIERRKSEKGRKFDDYLQILLDVGETFENQTSEPDFAEEHHAGAESGTGQRSAEAPDKLSGSQLSDDEIWSNATLLLAVSFENTATLLTHCFYALAFHKHVQVKLHEELRQIASPKGTDGYSFDYDSLSACRYLDAVISEALRALPPAPFIDRIACRDYLIEKYDIQVPKGTKIVLQVTDIMNNPEYWPEPQKFDPERFMPENRAKIVPGSYCPFGAGPRHCLGMRFALTEAKFALAKLVMDYEFEPAPGTSYPPASKFHFGHLVIEDPYARVTRRARC